MTGPNGTSVELTTANSGAYVPSRAVAIDSPHVIRLYLRDRLTRERAERGNPDYVVTVRAWRVTPAGTYLFPPVMEMSE